jgi:nucleoside-diphosphate-sugar epimerase
MTAQSLYDVKEFPPSGSSFVDVRDVAKAHIGALKNPDAAGRRYLLVGGRFSYEEAAKAIAKAVPEAASRFPSVEGAPFSPLFKVDSSAAEKDFGFKCELPSPLHRLEPAADISLWSVGDRHHPRGEHGSLRQAARCPARSGVDIKAVTLPLY